jgi:hypothetical protein
MKIFKEEDMKKFLNMILIFTMTFTLTACAEKEVVKTVEETEESTSAPAAVDAKAIYDEARKKLLEQTSMDVTSISNIRMIQGKNEMSNKTTMNITVSDINKESMKYSAIGTSVGGGEENETSIYCENGYCYFNCFGTKFKYAADTTEIMEIVKKGTQGAGLDSSYMKDIIAKKDDDNDILIYEVDVEKMDEYVDKIMSQIENQLNGATYSIQEVKGESTINAAGYFTKSNLNITLNLTARGESALLVFDTNITYNNPGQAVEVTTPDLEGYQEVDQSSVQVQ